MFRLISLALSALFLPALILPAGLQAAQEPARPDDSFFADSLDVQAINVQVVVTGPQGERVPGLSAKDFRILVNGQPVSLDFFLEVRDGRAVSVQEPDSQDPDSADAALPSALADVEAGDAVGNSYLIFIDDAFSPVYLRNEALKGLARDIQTLDPQDRVAVVTFDGRKLHVLSDWTSPGPELAQSIASISRSKRLLTGPTAAAQIQGQLLEIYDNLYPTGDSIANVRYRLAGVQRSALAATAAQRAFAPTATGRKIMLFLSGGWPYDRYSMAGLDWDMIKTLMGYQDRDGFGLLRPLTDTGNLLGYTVYPLHLMDTAILPTAATRTDPYTGGSPDNTRAFIALNTARNSMGFLADETGGKLLLAGNKNLSRIEADTRSYYWLGFTHSGADDKRRDLKVEVLQPQLKVRARDSFLPLSRPAKTSIEVESALITGKDLGAKPLEAGLGEIKRTGFIAAEVPLWVKIPTDQISMVEQDGKYAARLELRVMSLDKNGGQSEVAVVPVEIDGENAPTEGGFVVYKTTLKIRNVDQDLQVSLYDALSGENRMTRLRIER